MRLSRVVFKNTGLVGFWKYQVERLGVRGVLGDGLGALGDGVLGELAGEDEADGRLDLARAERLLLGEAADVGGLVADALEEVLDEVAHDDHALGRDARVRVHLLEDLVDVARVGLLGLLLLLVAGGLLTGLLVLYYTVLL